MIKKCRIHDVLGICANGLNQVAELMLVKITSALSTITFSGRVGGKLMTWL